jgi:hypothetical protein
MRHAAVVAALSAISLLAADLAAQGGRGRFRRAEEITNRVGAFFVDTKGPEADGDKVAGLETTELVRAAKAAGQPTVLYLIDQSADEDVRSTFERQLFASDELGIELRCFHCGRIDLAKETSLANAYAKKAPLFVVFDAEGKATEVPMVGYKASASALQKALEKSAQGVVKPSLAAFTKQYGGMVKDLEQLLNKQKAEQEKLAKAGDDAAKRKAAEKEIAALEAESKKLLDKENELLQKTRLPERPSTAQRVGGGWGGRDPAAGGGASGAAGGRRGG